MARTILKCIIMFNILIGLTQAALVKNQAGTQSYSRNSLEEPRFPSRSNDGNLKDQKHGDGHHGHHVDHLGNYVVDRFDHRYPDGSYEYRYELADGQARYERGYFIRINHIKSLVVVGYYSYRLPNGKFLTVFYNADHNGYRQNQSITRDSVPELPRSIDVPAFKDEPLHDVSSTTPRSNYNHAYITTKRNNI